MGSPSDGVEFRHTSPGNPGLASNRRSLEQALGGVGYWMATSTSKSKELQCYPGAATGLLAIGIKAFDVSLQCWNGNPATQVLNCQLQHSMVDSDGVTANSLSCCLDLGRQFTYIYLFYELFSVYLVSNAN